MLTRTLDEGQNDLKSKETVLALIPEIFMAMNEESQQDLIEIYQSMSRDSLAMVRRAAARSLRDLVKLIPPAPEAVLKAIF